MIKQFVIILISLIILSCNIDKPSVNNTILEIDTPWEFYNEKFILSEQQGNFGRLETYLPDNVLYFSGNTPKLKNNGNYLYGSIKNYINVTPGKNYSVYLSGILSASKVWVDGKLLGEYGVIASSLEGTTPRIKRAVLNFIPKNDKAEIIIEFSNFHFGSKWLFKWIVYGESSEIINLYIKNQSKDYFTSGLLIICSVLFLLIYLINKKDSYNLYFSLFTLSYGIRSYLMKNTTINQFIPWFTWTLEFQLNKASEIWALVFIILFLRALFPKEFNSVFIKFFIKIALCTSLLAFVPLYIFNSYNILLIMHIEILVAGFYIITRLLKCIKNHRNFAISAFVSIFLLFISIIFDIFANTIIILFDYYSAQFVILVVGVMFLMIGKKRYDTGVFVIEKEKINSEIKSVFSKFVPLDILRNLNNLDLDDRPVGEFSVKPVTMLFIDIRDFTKLSEDLTPKESFIMINRFYEIVGYEVKRFGGFIESYGGDGVKAIFQNSPSNAIDTALAISDEVALSSKIKIGMSIHFGRVVLGTIGGENRIQATAVSDVTRLLTSMDQFNSKIGIEILITSSVLKLIDLPSSSILNLGEIFLNDQDDSINLYQIIPTSYNIDPLFKKSFEDGVSMIKQKKYIKAYGYFQLANKYNQYHQLTKSYLQELETFFKFSNITFSLKV